MAMISWLCERCCLGIDVEIQALVEAVPADNTEVVALGVEEQTVDQPRAVSRSGGFAGTQLLVDNFKRFLFRLLTSSFRIVLAITRALSLSVLYTRDFLHAVFENRLQDVLFEERVHGNQQFAGCFIDHIFAETFPSRTLRQWQAQAFTVSTRSKARSSSFVVEIPERAEQRGDREFLLPVDVGVHHRVDIGSKLDPRSAERDDACRIHLLAVRVRWTSPKKTPGERCNWLTMTRSAPLMINVPFGVIYGRLPRYTSCSTLSK